MSAEMLSSQKMITFPRKEAYSATTSSTGRRRGRPVELLHAPLPQVFEELRPCILGLADEDRVGVGGGFFGQQGGVRSAQHDRDAAGAVSVGQLVGVVSGGGVEGDADQVGPGERVRRADFFVDMLHLPVRRGERGQVGHGDLLEVEKSRAADALDFGRRHGDKQQFSGHRQPRVHREGINAMITAAVSQKLSGGRQNRSGVLSHGDCTLAGCRAGRI